MHGVGVGDIPHVGVVDTGDAPQGVVGVGDRFALSAQVGSHFTDQASRIVVGKIGDAGFRGLKAGLEAREVVGDAASLVNTACLRSCEYLIDHSSPSSHGF